MRRMETATAIPGAGPFAKSQPNEPGRDAEDKDEDAGPGKCEHERGDENPNTDQPKDPAFVPAAKVILHGSRERPRWKCQRGRRSGCDWETGQSRVRCARKAARFA